LTWLSVRRSVMRVLLDEQLDHRLKPLFDPEFEVATVVELGWGGLEDREMLREAEQAFDALVTMDRGIPHQQNLRDLALGIVLIRAYSNRRADVAPLIPQVNVALRTVQAGEVISVESKGG
jgi:predicted nuclease of predicted toxin-antitoxin system